MSRHLTKLPVLHTAFGLCGHDGGVQGVATFMAFHAESKVGALLLTNPGDAKLDNLLARARAQGERL